MLTKDDVVLCKNIMEKHGKSYAFATRFFPKDLQQATAILYAFFRVPDDLVDETPGTQEEKTLRLQTWKERWNTPPQTPSVDHPVLRATRDIFATYHIPHHYGEAFLEAMTQDLTVTRYKTYKDLEKYMYGSAAVVGLIMSHIIGYKNKKTLNHAKALGEAMQLTNFIRDIKEDYKKRGRIYLPQEDMEKFNVSEEDIKHDRLTENVKNLLRYEIKRAKTQYAFAKKGINKLSPAGRLPVRVAAGCYEAILINIEKSGYDIFTQRVHTTFFEKLLIFFTVWKKTKNTRLSLGQDLEA